MNVCDLSIASLKERQIMITINGEHCSDGFIEITSISLCFKKPTVS